MRCTVMLICVLLTFLSDDIATILSFCGANITSTISFIIPGICALLYKKNSKNDKNENFIFSILDPLVLAFGILTLICGNLYVL